MRKLFSFAIIIAAISLTFMLTACEKEGTTEKAGKKVDSLIEKTKENVGNAVEDAKEAAEKAKKKVEDEVKY